MATVNRGRRCPFSGWNVKTLGNRKSWHCCATTACMWQDFCCHLKQTLSNENNPTWFHMQHNSSLLSQQWCRFSAVSGFKIGAVGLKSAVLGYNAMTAEHKIRQDLVFFPRKVEGYTKKLLNPFIGNCINFSTFLGKYCPCCFLKHLLYF